MSLIDDMQRIIPIMDHYEAYTNQGEFICSGATFEECSNELIGLIKAEVKMLQPILT